MPGLSSLTDIVAAQARTAAVRAKPESGAGLRFADVIDAVNPLQHIPVGSWAYRALTGDPIAGAAKMVGGALFGGPVGFMLATADNLWERASGRDARDTLFALEKGHDRSAALPAGAQVAQNDRTDTREQPTERPVGETQAEKRPTDQPVSALARAPDGPTWVLAATQLPQDQVDLLLRSVGLPVGNIGARQAASPSIRDAGVRMPAVPAAPVAVLELAEAQPMLPAYRQAELTAALAASQELLRAYGRP